jgi:DNA-binding MarR family transcriptional regulator
MTPEPLRVECARAILDVLPLWQRAVGVSLREAGGEVSFQQYRLLDCLSRGPSTLGEIAKKQVVTAATVTTIVGTLQSKGWVDISGDPNDRRLKIVSLTDLGWDVRDKARLRAEREIARVLGNLDDVETGCLLDALAAIRHLMPALPRVAGGERSVAATETGTSCQTN